MTEHRARVGDAAPTEARAAFDRLIGELRPKLHRYCARMTGSAIDGEDVVQDALANAIEAFPRAGNVLNPEGWIFRIAHNAAMDFLRRRRREEATRTDEDPDMAVNPVNTLEDRQAAAASFRTFMRLPAAQRSSVILMDVLGYSLQEIGEIMESGVPAVKAALHRGRAQLRELAREPDDTPPPILAEAERARLSAYIERFNARDFGALRDMLAEEVRLDLVNRSRRQGRTSVGDYFSNYAKVDDWRLVAGLVDRRPAILVQDRDDPSARPRYFILLEWDGDRLIFIRDFRYARYAIEGAELLTFT